MKTNYGFHEIGTNIKILCLLIILFVILSVFLCFLRDDFINITLSLFTLLIIMLNFFDKIYLNTIALILIITSAFDIIWTTILIYVMINI